MYLYNLIYLCVGFFVRFIILTKIILRYGYLYINSVHTNEFLRLDLLYVNVKSMK